ncbi:autotransporter assembly complex protein TamA [Orbus mooreae]|uniref:autotransporter assembly complex protein TamA n=1 Tax=Orbus mooreae TaxID=3074107 RepID=UPI00370D6028
MRRVIFSIVLSLIVVSSAASAKMTLSVQGLSGALEDNVDARLSMINSNQVDDTPYFKRYLESEIKKGLRALGYYNPTFSYNIPENSNKLVVTVDPGKPILIEQTDVNVTGDGENDPDYINLLKNDLPKPGSVLNHGDYDSFKKKLQNLALRKGYFDADMTKNQLAVSDSLHQAFWKIDFNTGERYKFGPVSFKETEIRQSYLRNIIPFKEGQPYTSEDITLLNRRLSSTNWFSSVTVVPLFKDVNKDKELPIYVITTPRKKNVVDVGLGYSSDNGFRGKLGWNKPWLNDRGHSLQTDFALSSPEQTITGVYKIPLYESPLEDYYTIQGGYKKIDNNDTYSNSYTVGVIRNWDSFTGWQKAVGLNVMYDNFTQASDSYETFLLYPSFSISRVRADGKLSPLWGDSQRYSLEVAAESLASDINFARFQMQQVWIRTIEERHRFVVRGNVGIIQASDFDRVPPTFRFFAGGDRSIRGFGYQSISPRDRDGKLKGASKLLTGSLEYQYNFSGAWWGALFVDSGEAIDKFDQTDFHTGAGFGVRWVSPIGPVKLDIASPVDKSKKSVHFYIGLGAEL